MDNYAKTSDNIIMTSPISITQTYQDNPSTEEVAVLFTDIVGSTEYFKVHGDKLGREMLRTHHNTASSIVSAFGGKVLKLIGDSIMASFVTPSDAFKAAISMQQRFKEKGNDKNTADNMSVRIGIHYGRVIVENNDIYGDVVNVASKLTNLAYGGQIFISGDIHNFVKNTPYVHFELIPNWLMKNIPYNIEAYSVFWDEKVELNPANDIMVYICPIDELADEDFKTIWTAFDCAEHAIIHDNAKRKIRLSDTSLMIFFTEAGIAVNASSYIMRFLAEKLSDKARQAILPVQIIIDNLLHLSEDDIISEGYRFDRASFKPGTINISEEVHNTICNLEDIAFSSINKTINNKQFYRLLSKNADESDEMEIFLYADTLIQGPHMSCFYCGSKKHACMDCPSKNLPEITHALDRLGYFSFDAVNELFLKSLISDIPNSNAEKSDTLPFYSFYELTRVYQLRFLRSIWEITSDDWTTATDRLCETEGGFAWIAQDSLRISDYATAETLIKKSFEHHPDDFSSYCVLGFLDIEKNDYVQAVNHFNIALLYATSHVHKTFVQLLLARIYKMNNRYDEASKIIGSIISKTPSCLDAAYLDIIIKFRQDKLNLAVRQLVKLIESNRKYFICAYIDPELKPYKKHIMPELSKIFKKAKIDAEDALAKAETELSVCTKTMDKQIVAEMQSILLKAKNAYETGSYYGYLDALFYCNLIVSRCADYLMEMKKAILTSIRILKERISNDIDYLNTYRFRGLTLSYRNQLQNVSGMVDKIYQNKDAITYENLDEYRQLCNNMSEEIDKLEERLQNTYQLEQSIRLFLKLSSLGLIFLSIVFLTGFFILPHLLYYLNNSVLMGSMPFQNVSLYQRLFYFFGFVVSVCILLVIGIKEFNKTD